MNSRRHDRCLVEKSHDEDDHDVNIEGNVIVADVNISDISGDDSTSSHCSNRSYKNHWPQSFRDSIDVFSAVIPPSVGILHGVSSLSKLSNYLTTSLQNLHTPNVTPSSIEPLLPESASRNEQQQHQLVDGSDSLLPSTSLKNKSSFRRPKIVGKSSIQNSFVSRDIPTGPQKCTYGQAVLNGINLLCGLGLLSTPNAVKQGGWLSLLVLLLFAVLAFYTGMLLRRCLDSEPGLETYPDIARAAFGREVCLVISIFLYMELYAACVEYIILDSDNLSSLFPSAKLNIGGLHMDSHILFAILTTVIVLPTTWVQDLSILSYLSAGGVIANVLVALTLFYIGVVDQVSFAKPVGPLFNLSGFPIAVGIYGFCYAGHAVFPNIYTSLQQPSHYTSVMFISFLFATLLFGGVGICGYAMFGDATESQFTLNMPKNLVASKFAVWVTVVNPITNWFRGAATKKLSSIIIRTALVISTFLVAISVPFFGLVMGFVGSFLTMLIALIVPCLCFLRIVKGNATRFEVTLCTTIIAIGVFSAIIGSYTAGQRIIQSLF